MFSCFVTDGRLALTGSEDHTAQLWDTATGKPCGPALSHADGVTSVGFSPDGTTIVRFTIPPFREGTAAVIISAHSTIGNDEVKQLVKRKK